MDTPETLEQLISKIVSDHPGCAFVFSMRYSDQRGKVSSIIHQTNEGCEAELCRVLMAQLGISEGYTPPDPEPAWA